MPNRPHPMAITAGNFYPSSPSRSDKIFPRKKKRIQIFHGAGCEGTRASVVVASVPPTDSELRIASLNDDSEALCWVWSRDQQVQVRCFYRDQPIRFCGHGLLASAYAWQTSHPDGTMPLTIRTATAAYTVTQEHGLWLHCNRIVHHVTDSFPAHWFDLPPQQAASAGGNDGYWIFRWPRGFDLQRIGPRLDTMARETRRGIIATAQKDTTDTVTVRYFAPAYGQPEDSATGSAAVILADYWAQPDLRLEQRSAKGGILKTRLNAHSVALSGAIRGLHEETGTE